MLNNILLISMSFLVRCINPFCLASSEMSFFESEGEDMVAATSAAIAASSFGERPFLLSFSSSSFRFRSPSLPPEKRSFKNCGVSSAGSWISDTAALTDFNPPEAVSNMPWAVSCAVFIHSFVVFLTSEKSSRLGYQMSQQEIYTPSNL